MEILVINGSPKGKNSVTLQTVNYLQLLHPEHHFEILHAGQTIKALEKDFSPAVQAIERADVLLFSYPVYTFIAPCQLHRFIELLKEVKLDLSQKFASQLSTSKHFYDMTAHRYIQDNCADLGLRYIRGLSADMAHILAAIKIHSTDDALKEILHNRGLVDDAAAGIPAPDKQIFLQPQLTDPLAEHGLVGQIALDDSKAALIQLGRETKGGTI